VAAATMLMLCLSAVQVVAHLGLSMSHIETMGNWDDGGDFKAVFHCVRAGSQPAGAASGIGKRRASKAAAAAAETRVRVNLLGCWDAMVQAAAALKAQLCDMHAYAVCCSFSWNPANTMRIFLISKISCGKCCILLTHEVALNISCCFLCCAFCLQEPPYKQARTSCSSLCQPLSAQHPAATSNRTQDALEGA
jgi:hypothetical protein